MKLLGQDKPFEKSIFALIQCEEHGHAHCRHEDINTRQAVLAVKSGTERKG